MPRTAKAPAVPTRYRIPKSPLDRPAGRLVLVTPEMAEQILTSDETRNRSLISGRVEQYARDMKAGRWQVNGEGISFDRDGNLLNGQHRLWAIIMSGVSVWTMIVEDVDPRSMATIDTGKVRSFANFQQLNGETKNTNLLAAATKWMFWYTGEPRTNDPNHLRPTHGELDAYLKVNADIRDRTNEVSSTHRARNLVRGAVLVMVYALAYRHDPAKAGAFLRLLDDGANMDEKHPVHQLRERMISNKVNTAKLPALDVAALTIKAWNQFLHGKRTVTLRWTAAEELPEMNANVVTRSPARQVAAQPYLSVAQ